MLQFWGASSRAGPVSSWVQQTHQDLKTDLVHTSPSSGSYILLPSQPFNSDPWSFSGFGLSRVLLEGWVRNTFCSSLTSYAFVHSPLSITKKEFLWWRLRTAQTYEQRHKYLESSLTTQLFTKLAIASCPKGPMILTRCSVPGMNFLLWIRAQIPSEIGCLPLNTHATTTPHPAWCPTACPTAFRGQH